MSWTCPRCQQPVYFAEKVSSLGKNWHRFCLKCERCQSVLSPGGHAEHNGRPYCHKPCYGALFGPRGVNIGGVGCYLYNPPTPSTARSISLSPSNFSPPRPRIGLPQAKKKWPVTPCSPTPDTAALASSYISSGFLMIELLQHGAGELVGSSGPGRMTKKQVVPNEGPPYMKTFTGETSLCPGCGDPVYFAEKVMSLGRNWHRPCLRCQRCRKTLTAGSHAEHDGIPYCHIPCYGYLFGPKGVNIGNVGCYIYDPVDIRPK